MPGIVGFAGVKSDRLTQMRALQEMQDLVTYKDFYQRDELFADEYICASASHLGSIQKWPQPYSKEGVYIWLDGEFYNQKEFAAYDAGIGTDAELLYRAYIQDRRLDFLPMIDGIFSAVIYDTVQKSIYIITDRYGLRHIYWTLYNGGLAWFSEAKGVLALPGYQPCIDKQAVKEFFSIGYLIEERSWFEGVKLLQSGSYIRWDIKTARMDMQRYWWWNRIKLDRKNISVTEAVEESGRLFRKAVEKRCRGPLHSGLTLSGGRDSRAILAAFPQVDYPIHSVTFGKKDCDDIIYARMAAHVRGAQHHVVEISPENWLMPRLDAVWWTDGHKSLIHLHGAESLELMRELFDVNLDGISSYIISGSFLYRCGYSDACRKYYDQPFTREMAAEMLACPTELITDFDRYSGLRKTDQYILQNRARRFSYDGVKSASVLIHHRMPFYDNDLVEFEFSIPDAVRHGKKIYNKMLLAEFPNYYKTIPWQYNGFTIDTPELVIKLMRRYRIMMGRGRLIQSFTNYNDWIRKEPAYSFIENLLFAKDALYKEHIPEKDVRETWEKHISGENQSEMLSLYATFEIWLQQVFNGRYRTFKESDFC